MVWLSTFESKILLKMQYSSATFFARRIHTAFLSQSEYNTVYLFRSDVISSFESAVVKQAVHLPIMEIWYSS